MVVMVGLHVSPICSRGCGGTCDSYLVYVPGVVGVPVSPICARGRITVTSFLYITSTERLKLSKLHHPVLNTKSEYV